MPEQIWQTWTKRIAGSVPAYNKKTTRKKGEFTMPGSDGTGPMGMGAGRGGGSCRKSINGQFGGREMRRGNCECRNKNHVTESSCHGRLNSDYENTDERKILQKQLEFHEEALNSIREKLKCFDGKANA